jgi:hypothetical protein
VWRPGAGVADDFDAVAAGDPALVGGAGGGGFGEVDTEHEEPAWVQDRGDSLETPEGVLLGEEVFVGADEAMDEVEAAPPRDAERFHAILPEEGLDPAFREGQF